MDPLETAAQRHAGRMRLALLEAERARAEGEIPVGAVAFRGDGTLVACGHNRTLSDHDPTAHAEMQVLRAAGAALGTYRLTDLELYVTLEPCVMCAMALIHARVRAVYFGAFDPRTGALGSAFNLLSHRSHNHHYPYCGGILGAECSALLKSFFRERRQMQKAGRDYLLEQGRTRFWE